MYESADLSDFRRLRRTWLGAHRLGELEKIRVRPAILRSQSGAKSFVKSYDQVGREFNLGPFPAGSIWTFAK